MQLEFRRDFGHRSLTLRPPNAIIRWCQCQLPVETARPLRPSLAGTPAPPVRLGPMTQPPPAERAQDTVKVRSRFRYRLLSSAINAAVLSSMIGAVGALVRVGPDGFWTAFAQGAPVGFATALPASLLVVPVVQRLVDRLFGLDPPD